MTLLSIRVHRIEINGSTLKYIEKRIESDFIGDVSLIGKATFTGLTSSFTCTLCKMTHCITLELTKSYCNSIESRKSFPNLCIEKSMKSSFIGEIHISIMLVKSANLRDRTSAQLLSCTYWIRAVTIKYFQNHFIDQSNNWITILQ